MDLHQLTYFVAVVETGSFTRAAERALVSQPSLSIGIKKLEHELGVRLFERGGRHAVLTPAGSRFLERARVMLEQYEAAFRELREVQQAETLKLGVLRTIRITSLARLISQFQPRHPGVVVELRVGTVEDIRNWHYAGTIDVAVTLLTGREEPQASLPLFHQRRLLAVSPAHPFASRASVRLVDLNEQPYIERTHCEMREESRALLDALRVRPRIVHRADHEEWVIALVAAGLGMTIMPEWRDALGIVYVPLSDFQETRTIGLVCRQQQDSALVRAFRAFAASHDWRVA
jgi:DNA-binding transcriptional LysR family regulator